MLVVFGSNNMDVVMQVGRLPAPGETVLSHGYGLKPGGKGANQAVAAVRDESDVRLVAAIGDDAFGRELQDHLTRENLGAHLVASDQPTGCAAVMVGDDAENQIVVASGANAALSHIAVPDEWLGTGNTVLMQMEVPVAENAALAARARAGGAKTILNLAPAPEQPLPDGMIQNLDYLVVNQVEAGQLVAMLGLRQERNPVLLARQLSHETGTALVMTLGKDGALGVEANNSNVYHVAPKTVDVVDTTGAGDTFTGVFAAAIDNGATLPQAMQRAAIASALACTGLGAQTAMPRAAQTNEYSDSHPMPVLVDEQAFSPKRTRKP